MNKYFTLYQLSWQKQLEVRSDFFFERSRAICILFSLYFLWSALLNNQTSALGYTRDELLTYVLMMTLLRAWVLACVTDRMPSEIAKGKITDILLRPLSHFGYWATQDAASKSLNLCSAILEVSVFVLFVGAPFIFPHEPKTWVFFGLSTLAAMIIYFQMSYLLGVMGFWTSQSWGPRFCFEIVLEFCAGAFFPIDILPAFAQRLIHFSPFPYLIYTPLSIYLGRFGMEEIKASFLAQGIWIIFLSLFIQWFWKKGLQKYAAEGR